MAGNVQDSVAYIFFCLNSEHEASEFRTGGVTIDCSYGVTMMGLNLNLVFEAPKARMACGLLKTCSRYYVLPLET